MALFHNNIQPALHQSSDPVVEAHEGLVIAIVAAAVDNEGIQYLDTYDGQNWLEITLNILAKGGSPVHIADKKAKEIGISKFATSVLQHL